jgi:hypothetical protein
MTISWDDFVEKYKIKHDDQGSIAMVDSWEDERIQAIIKKHKDEAWRYVWTWCSEGETDYYVAGFARVNRMAYLIADTAHEYEPEDLMAHEFD